MKTTLFLSIFSCLLLHFSAKAQNEFTKRDEMLIRARVQQLDEFVSRFNLEISVDPETPLPKKGSEEFIELRKAYINSLFDKGWVAKASPAEKANMESFIQEVVKQQTFLKYSDANWFAVSTGEGVYQKKKHKIDFTFSMKTSPTANKWVLAAVNSPFLSIEPKVPEVSLSPVSHELMFGKFKQAVANDKENIAGYATEGFQPDQRQAFFFLVKNDQLTISQMHRPVFHFLQVKGWLFTVKFFERADLNAGWLITDLRKANANEKNQYRQETLYLLP